MEQDHVIEPFAGTPLYNPVGEPGIEERPSNLPDTNGLEARLAHLEEELHLLKHVLGKDTQARIDKARAEHEAERAGQPAAQIDAHLTPAQRSATLEDEHGQSILHPIANQNDASGHAHPGTPSHDLPESSLPKHREHEEKAKADQATKHDHKPQPEKGKH